MKFVDGIVRAIRTVLAVGSLVFLLSAACLLAAPSLFAEWLGLTSSDALDWALRMTGACLLALSGQMWLVRRADDAAVRGAAFVMIVAGGTMSILTVLIPGPWTTLRWAYLAFGLVFCLTYAGLILTGYRQDSRRT